MNGTSPIDAATERKRVLSRERMRRWRERNPELARERGQRWREANIERARELSRTWNRENQARIREASRRFYKANPEYSREYYRRNREAVRERIRLWKARNPAKVREYKRRYRERMRALRVLLPAFGELRKSALMSNNVYAAASAAVPAHLPAWLRDDVVSEIVLSIYEGSADLSNLAAVAKAAMSKHSTLFRELSLNTPQYEGGPDWIDTLTDEDVRW